MLVSVGPEMINIVIVCIGSIMDSFSIMAKVLGNKVTSMSETLAHQLGSVNETEIFEREVVSLFEGSEKFDRRRHFWTDEGEMGSGGGEGVGG